MLDFYGDECDRLNYLLLFWLDEVGALVFDIGHSSFRAGFAGEDCPKIDIPSTVGYIEEVVEKSENGNNSAKRYLMGPVPLRTPIPNMELTSFLKDSMSMFVWLFVFDYFDTNFCFMYIVEDWDLFEKMLDFVYMKHLNLDPSLNSVLFSEASVSLSFHFGVHILMFFVSVELTG